MAKAVILLFGLVLCFVGHTVCRLTPKQRELADALSQWLSERRSATVDEPERTLVEPLKREFHFAEKGVRDLDRILKSRDVQAVIAQRELAERCRLHPETGPCRARIPMYFYNATSGRCEHFAYGGCDGNDNRFEKIEGCKAYCRPSSEEICRFPPLTGPCRARMPMFYHNSKSGHCEEFVYGGCDGNDNKFPTKQACNAKCKPHCSLPPVTGPCRADIKMFYHNQATGKCEEFVYGGCDGNANRFETAAECRNECGSGDVCSLPSESGPCYGYFKMFYYNQAAGKCEEFVYGGCRGNGNRFQTVEACNNKCGSK